MRSRKRYSLAALPRVSQLKDPLLPLDRGGQVTVSTAATGQNLIIIVADSGDGISPSTCRPGTGAAFTITLPTSR